MGDFQGLESHLMTILVIQTMMMKTIAAEVVAEVEEEAVVEVVSVEKIIVKVITRLEEEEVVVEVVEPALNAEKKATSQEIALRAEVAVVVAIEHASSVAKRATSPETAQKEVVEAVRASIVAKKVTCQEIAQTQEMKMLVGVEAAEEAEVASIEVASIVKMSRWKIQQQQLEDGDQLMVKIMMLHGALLKMREAGILQRTHLMISKPLQVVDGELQKLQNKRNKQVIGIIQK